MLLFDFRPGRRHVGPELVRRTGCEAVEVEVTVPQPQAWPELLAPPSHARRDRLTPLTTHLLRSLSYIIELSSPSFARTGPDA